MARETRKPRRSARRARAAAGAQPEADGREGYPVAAWAAAASGDLNNTIAASTAGGIERQEREGQEKLRTAEHLPRRVMSDGGWDVGLRFGFKVDLLHPVDKLFVPGTLPPGWKKIPTDHALHTRIVDETGRERATIFYKAAFYDRDAWISFRPRYRMEQEFLSKAPDAWRTGPFAAKVMDGDRILFRTAVVEVPTSDRENHGCYADRVKDEAWNWLQRTFPFHGDILAYWDPPYAPVETPRVPIEGDTFAAAARRVRRGWCRGGFALDAEGHPTRPRDAALFCMAGAIRASVPIDSYYGAYIRALEGLLGEPPAAYNDAPGRTAEQVAQALDRAAAHYEMKGA